MRKRMTKTSSTKRMIDYLGNQHLVLPGVVGANYKGINRQCLKPRLLKLAPILRLLNRLFSVQARLPASFSDRKS